LRVIRIGHSYDLIRFDTICCCCCCCCSWGLYIIKVY
jgi:hypothetical protein